VLEFVNNFLSLFYVAFVKQDLKLLQSQLMTQLIILQFIQNAQETLVPKLRQYMGQFMGSMLEKVKYEKLEDCESLEGRFDELHLHSISEDDPRIKQRRKEGLMDEYNTYDDYLELYIQFGYVVLFAAVAPLAAFWAFLNNIFEIRLDAFRLCRVYRRPFAKRVKNTGSWQLAFEALGVIAIVTNCGILYLSPEIR
jgi:anoctamin-10